MPHIAVVISGLSGRMHSGFELVSRLEREGHQVTCLCQPYTTEIVARQGFAYLEIPEVNFIYSDCNPDSSSEADTDPTSWFQKLRRHIKGRRGRYELGKKILRLGEYEKIWRELKPDYALVDVELHDLIFTAYGAKIPLTLFHTWFSDTPSIELPPIRTTIIPRKGIKGSPLGIAWARFIDWAKIRGRLYINQLMFREYRRTTLKKYASEIGFPVANLSLSTLPPLYRFNKLPILLLAMRELDFPHRPAPNSNYVGPMVYENRNDLDSDFPDTERLKKIFAIQKTTGKKLVYCAVGSLAKGDVPFLKKVIEVVGKEKDWLLILSLGRNLSKDVFYNSPENVYVFPWVPQLKVLAHADVCINHAGVNSINECLHFAVPMVIYSLKYTDENGNAARMAYHGLAILGDKDQDDVALIRKKISAVLADPKYQKTVSEFHAIYENYRQRELSPLIIR